MDTNNVIDIEKCPHYARSCSILAPCCNTWYACRLCHNEAECNINSHVLYRRAISKMKCNYCQTIQPCAKHCSKCKQVMGNYYCNICKFFDHDSVRKKPFHCKDCGICRVGGRENFYHCNTCNACYSNSLRDKHTCLASSMQRECAICYEYMHNSRSSVQVLPCGHAFHGHCLKQAFRYISNCPLCRR